MLERTPSAAFKTFRPKTQRTCSNFALFRLRGRCHENRYYLARLEL